MTALILLTAALLAVVLLGGLLAMLMFAVQICRFGAQTAVALSRVDEGASRVAGHIEALQHAAAAAAASLGVGAPGSGRRLT